MALAVEDRPAQPVIAPRPRGPWRTAWEAPLWAHTAALAVVLVMTVLVVGTYASYSADEGAAIIQAQSLADGGGWLVEHPLPAADPAQVDYPLELSEWSADGVAPYAKHPAYPVLLAAASRLGGVTAMVLASVFGTLIAALVAARIARRLDPRLERPTLWATGVASPLFFDANLVMAHTLGAAAAGLAALAALNAGDPGRRRPWRWVAVAATAMTVAGLLRTEGALLAVGLAAAVGVTALTGLRQPDRARLIRLITAGALFASGAGAVLLDRIWQRAVVGSPADDPSTQPDDESLSFLAARARGFTNTWLTSNLETGAFVVLLVSVVLAVAVVAARRRPPDGRAVALFTAAAGGLAVARLLVAEADAISGLLLAFPLLWVGLALGGRRLLTSADARVLAMGAGLFALAVLATQYPEGGSAEWGGRYFAVGLPLVVPLAVAGLAKARSNLEPEARRVGAASLVIVATAFAVLGVAELRTAHRTGDDIVRAAELAGAAAEAGDGGRPVIVATAPLLPRLAWQTFDEQRWLLVDPDRPADADLVSRLRDTGITRLVYVTPGPPEGDLMRGATITATVRVHGWWIETIELR